MAKQKPEAEILAKKEKKEKKRKREEAGEEAEVGITSERKKKDKKRKSADATTGVLNALEAEKPGSVAVDADGDVIVDAAAGAEVTVVKEDEDEEKKPVVMAEAPLAALVPFANPLCDDKSQKKVLKSVKKGKYFSHMRFGFQVSRH